jgi:hypothetical protein
MIAISCASSEDTDATSSGTGAAGGEGPSGGLAGSGNAGGDPGLQGVGGGSGDDGCKKIDFLFVVDNSASMGAYQTQLIDAYGPFMDTIFSTVEANDFHVMVVKSDGAETIDQTCEPCTPESFWCGDWCSAKNGLDVACEKTLGAGQVAPYNNEASNSVCGVPAGQRYLDSALGEADIKSIFPCMAQVGIFGSGAEQPMSAMAAALTTEANAGGCNEGFLRDDAVLVVTVISDDYPVPTTADDASTVGSADEWFAAVSNAKQGKPENVVMLGIVNTPDAACVSGAGDPIVHPTQKFMDLVAKFGKTGVAANICLGDFNAFFQEAVALIDTTCDEFDPPK